MYVHKFHIQNLFFRIEEVEENAITKISKSSDECGGLKSKLDDPEAKYKLGGSSSLFNQGEDVEFNDIEHQNSKISEDLEDFINSDSGDGNSSIGHMDAAKLISHSPTDSKSPSKNNKFVKMSASCKF